MNENIRCNSQFLVTNHFSNFRELVSNLGLLIMINGRPTLIKKFHEEDLSLQSSVIGNKHYSISRVK